MKYFEGLYGEPSKVMNDLPSEIFPRFKDPNIEILGKFVFNEEINRVIFYMNLLKALGSDRYQAIFFQSQWDTVGNDVCLWVQGIFAGKCMDPELNNSLLVFIPKKSNLEDFSQFRPISLCSVLYKLVMKVIFNRFKLVFLNYIWQE